MPDIDETHSTNSDKKGLLLIDRYSRLLKKRFLNVLVVDELNAKTAQGNKRNA